MHYTGTIDATSATGKAGSQFDSSRGRGQTFDFVIGQGQVIQGWEQGLIGLCKGAKATLIIPPEMGYGEQGAGGDIPGGATLNFDVEVVDFGAPPPPPDIFGEIDADKDAELTTEELLNWFKENREMDELPDGLMESMDADSDGKISWDEFNGPKSATKPVKGGEEL